MPCATLEVMTPVLLKVPAFGKVTVFAGSSEERSAFVMHGGRCKERETRTL